MSLIEKGTFIMRRSLRYFSAAFVAALLVCSSSAHAAIIVLSDDFSGGDGNLVGSTPDVSTGAWGQTGTNSTNPIQVSGGKAAIGPANQDAFAAFSSSVPHTDGGAIHTSMDINVSAAGTGDYFSHLSDPAGTTQFFFQRLGAAASGAGYVLHLAVTGGGGAVTTLGTTVLNFNQTYHVDINWNFVAGATNDTFQILVDNAAYMSKTWDSTNAEPTAVSAGNFRQGGGAGAAPTLTVDNLNVDVPEPAALILAGVIGLMGFVVRRSRG
jgi:hypothetical protein